MATYDQRYAGPETEHYPNEGERSGHRVHTETGKFSRTSEFWVFLVTALAVLIAGSAVGANGDKADVFAADRVWLYVTLLASAYLVSRGIAKAGSHGHDPVDDGHSGHGRGDHGPPLGERVKAAARVLTDGPGGEHAARHDGDATEVTTRRPPAS